MLGTAVGSVGALAVSLALLGARGETATVNVALALALCIVAGVAVGGRAAGIVSSVVAAGAFDLLHTQPYGSPRIARPGDLLTTGLLLGVGLLAGQLAVRSDRSRRRLHETRRAVTRLQGVTALTAAHTMSGDAMADAVAAEIRELLSLRDCWFERPPFVARFPELGSRGVLATTVWHYTPEGFELPAGGVELPVVSGDELLGRLLLVPEPGVGISVERRVVAVALADQLAGYLVARPAA